MLSTCDEGWAPRQHPSLQHNRVPISLLHQSPCSPLPGTTKWSHKLIWDRIRDMAIAWVTFQRRKMQEKVVRWNNASEYFREEVSMRKVNGASEERLGSPGHRKPVRWRWSWGNGQTWQQLAEQCHQTKWRAQIITLLELEVGRGPREGRGPEGKRGSGRREGCPGFRLWSRRCSLSMWPWASVFLCDLQGTWKAPSLCSSLQHLALSTCCLLRGEAVRTRPWPLWSDLAHGWPASASSMPRTCCVSLPWENEQETWAQMPKMDKTVQNAISFCGCAPAVTSAFW